MKKIFTKKIAIELIKAGCKCVDVERNYKYPHLFVWVFEDNELFEKKFAELQFKN